MQGPTHFVFVYGTLKRGGNLHLYLTDASRTQFVGHATLRNHVLFDLGAFPGIHPGKGQVHGEVYEVTTSILKQLDICEGEGHLYDRRRVFVGFDEGNRLEMETYTYIYRGQAGQPIASGVWPVSTTEAS